MICRSQIEGDKTTWEQNSGYRELHDEIADLDDMIEVNFKDLDPERLKSEASVAALCGVCPEAFESAAA